MLYWTSEAHTAADTTERMGLEVLQYEYTEAVKLQISFELQGSAYEPIIELGQGTSLEQPTWGKAYIWKTTTGLLIRQITETGDTVDVAFNADKEIKVAGNTGSGLNIRNTAIAATAPESPQAGDMWINTGA